MSTEDRIQLVRFRVAKQDFAINIFEAERILEFKAPSPLPKAPVFLEGVLAYGDGVVPVIDLRKRLSVAAALHPETRIMILAWDDERVGVVVDAVSEVLRVEADAIKPPPALVRGLAAEYITGLVALGEHTVIMLAARKLSRPRNGSNSIN